MVTASDSLSAASAISLPGALAWSSLPYVSTPSVNGPACLAEEWPVEAAPPDLLFPTGPIPTTNISGMQHIGKLGSGSWGKVDKMVDASGATFALKQPRAAHGDTTQDAEDQRESIAHEIHMLQLLHGHPRVMPMLSVVGVPVDTLQGKQLVRKTGLAFSMPLALGGTVFDFQKDLWLKGWRTPPLAISRCFLQAAEGLAHLHANRIVHLDVKTDNFLLVGERELGQGPLDFHPDVRMADMGYAQQQTMHAGTGWLSPHPAEYGTMGFASPELLDGHPYLDLYASDVYSLGKVLMDTILMVPPVMGNSPEGTFDGMVADFQRQFPGSWHEVENAWGGQHIRLLDMAELMCHPEPAQR
ncbi:hypothetical protein WJX73_009007 [Symbiochloris irregularis]|uniref:Protein kinase domain-containing protein n=1 Tax=Symbiochloris irregularis TaxID=706552 RepID=A0AAW1PVU9_9CHLO